MTYVGGLLGSAPAPAGKSLLDYVADGGEIGVVIILLSFVGVGLMVANLIRIRLGQLAPPEVVELLHSKLRANDTQGAQEVCATPENECFLTRVFGAALLRCSRSPFGLLELKSSLEEAGQHEVAKLYRSTDAIGLIATVAPMLGLLGTVVGMVGAFETIGLTDGVTHADELAGSISTALITTVMGLIVAIPTTAVFTFLRNRIDHFAAEVAQITEDLAAHLESAGDDASGARKARTA